MEETTTARTPGMTLGEEAKAININKAAPAGLADNSPMQVALGDLRTVTGDVEDLVESLANKLRAVLTEPVEQSPKPDNGVAANHAVAITNVRSRLNDVGLTLAYILKNLEV